MMLSFFKQIRYTTELKCLRFDDLKSSASGKLSSGRRFLMIAVQSILHYGFENWINTLSKEMYRKRNYKVDRNVLIDVMVILCLHYRVLRFE